ncbi:PIN domain-containing protein [Roseofilum reptotaenium CS-1145]|uniref:Twitching motility protein PilT n=1 Tax=Roseofilum reptotaenium AO1-A TaxID=1925591 RepID=A0A1L9QQ04_9CYAN|nr:PIN domain-containing protein [Roseofilum reptotaenium]MDB9517487.1 PIN domain-containing protein [Roseofilum reptotaenium CS-1145]OJJ24729.1 twitching motility protein PilT [Roseofilum reptotaenium AO1-A]
MNGNRYLLDTNAIITLLQGNPQLIQLLQNASWIGISIVSQIKFLVFSGLTERDRQLFHQFLQRVNIVGLSSKDTGLIAEIVKIRQLYRLKLPDAAIAAMAIHHSASLVTADREFTKVNPLNVIGW